MTPAQIVKILVAAAILLALVRQLKKSRTCRRIAASVSPFGGWDSDYEEDSDGAYDEDEAEAFDEDAEDEDPESDVDAEDDDAEDEDAEDDDAEDEDAEDEDAEMAAPVGFNVATDLLPKRAPGKGQDWGEFAPKSLLGQQFLDAKKFIGVDTQGSSLRNANYDLRSSPTIARRDIGPWAQSTIETDLLRKPLE